MYVTKSRFNLFPVVTLFMMVTIQPVLLNAQQAMSEYVSTGVIADSLGSILERYDMMGGILSLACKDEPAQFFPVGLADLEATDPITADTPFRIASISKMVTALGVLKLVESQQLGLDTPIEQYLGAPIRNPNHPELAITARHLLSHQSSLLDGAAYNRFLNQSYSSEVPPALSELFLPTGEYYSDELFAEQAPGSWFQYSNLGFGILGTLIEKVSGEAFDVFIKREIFDPIELQAGFSSYTRGYEELPATLYRKPNNQWTPQADRRPSEEELQTRSADGPRYPQPRAEVLIGVNAIPYGPQGGLRISARDLMSLLGHMQTALSQNYTPEGWLHPETIAQMTQIQWHADSQPGDTYGGLFRAWGLGVHVLTGMPGMDVMMDNSAAMFGHSGLAYGLVSSAYFDPERGIRLSFITNGIGRAFSEDDRSAFYSVEKDMFELAESILKKFGC
jgi:CubicO group peptidase (beta-lactamase class C family)